MSTPMFELPQHHPIEVDAYGNGPADPKDTVRVTCWCGDDECEEYLR